MILILYILSYFAYIARCFFTKSTQTAKSAPSPLAFGERGALCMLFFQNMAPAARQTRHTMVSASSSFQIYFSHTP